ncbi:MAG TPA: type II toxin-antitoxin system HicB family antitoxin [Dehalococcoidia bacterium]|nr:type II toxin-antitoxin system HicB family antitoxin [Dehalococcoidia bacterium]
MLTEYIAAAMKRAKYKILEDDGTYFGEIPGFRGVWSNADTLEDCRQELQEVLEGWILLSLKKDARLPVIERINLNRTGRASRVA